MADVIDIKTRRPVSKCLNCNLMQAVGLEHESTRDCLVAVTAAVEILNATIKGLGGE